MSTSQEPTIGSGKRVQFGVEGGDSDSDSSIRDVHDSSKADQEETEYYDPVYFDSDSGSDESDYDESSHGPRIGHEMKMQMKDITHGLETSTLGSASASTSASQSSSSTVRRKKMHPTMSNADLLYDPDEDDRDQDWLIRKIAANRPPGCKPEDIWTDAILSCPMCLTHLCFDCQQHEYYPHQFRAMFVENCRVLENEVLRFTKETKSSRNAHRTPKASSSTPPTVGSSAASSTIQPGETSASSSSTANTLE